MNKYFHQIAMWLIFLGAAALAYFSFLWFSRGNGIMGFGMLAMAVIAFSNFYLHRMAMKDNIERRE